MTMLIAVADARTDAPLVEAARALAKAAGWDAGIVHVRETAGEAGLDHDAFGDIAVAELNGAPAPTIRLLVDEAGGGRPGHGPAAHQQEPAWVTCRRRCWAACRRRCCWCVRACGRSPPCGACWCRWRAAPPRSEAVRFADDLFCTRGREILIAARGHGRHARRERQHAGAARGGPGALRVDGVERRVQHALLAVHQGRAAPRERARGRGGALHPAGGRRSTTWTSSCCRGAAASRTVTAR